MNISQIGDRIKLLRQFRGLSQEELAKLINCNRISIMRYENGANLLETHNLIKLALLFKVSTDFLLGISDIKENDGIEKYENILDTIIIKSFDNSIEDENYFWIYKIYDEIGGQSDFAGFNNSNKEMRTLREVNPQMAIRICTEHYGPPMIINNKEEALAFKIIGGNAIVRKSICKEYLPEFLELFIVN